MTTSGRLRAPSAFRLLYPHSQSTSHPKEDTGSTAGVHLSRPELIRKITVKNQFWIQIGLLMGWHSSWASVTSSDRRSWNADKSCFLFFLLILLFLPSTNILFSSSCGGRYIKVNPFISILVPILLLCQGSYFIFFFSSFFNIFFIDSFL